MPNQQQTRTPHTSLPYTRKPEPKLGRAGVLAIVQILEFLLKLAALNITLLGIFAWIAGSCYRYGFWSQVGNGGPISSISLQETALYGFISPYKIWLWAVLAISVFSIFIAALGIGIKRKERQPKNSAIRIWLEKRFSYDKSFFILSMIVFTVACFIYSYLIFPIGLWVVGSYSTGKDNFLKSACHAKLESRYATTITLDNGKTINGWLLDRSDKFLMLADGGHVYTVAIGEKVRLMDTTALALDCKPPSV
ncbi:hypothetical protein CXB49_19990 [Chromobacterium sp. ATCC 53434]|uniref:hypothetical protein n=1 Tax=Chromobacterium sp. (strain ATCC 53434 / SC 14030) TaxID=2059672 RepID=UPI000C792AB4|nr:hypothetical protein [Chromobacterium sp. ATCC 53434]AUH52906.1 hypothetical protein CXB49_19990 [Chromobacterium sp. ATCC 53434]